MATRCGGAHHGCPRPSLVSQRPCSLTIGYASVVPPSTLVVPRSSLVIPDSTPIANMVRPVLLSSVSLLSFPPFVSCPVVLFSNLFPTFVIIAVFHWLRLDFRAGSWLDCKNQPVIFNRLDSVPSPVITLLPLRATRGRAFSPNTGHGHGHHFPNLRARPNARYFLN
jgi:hypothetical protein